MNDKKEDLCIYRIRNAVETLGVAVLCLESQHYKDSINRSYYAAFYAIKAVLALEEIDFKRHKDAVATVYKGNIIKNLIMDCQSYTKYRPNETTGGIFVSWRRKEELPTGA